MSDKKENNKPYQVAFKGNNGNKTISISIPSDLHTRVGKLAIELSLTRSDIYTKGAEAFLETMQSIGDEVKNGEAEATREEEIKLNLFFK
jgi:predicted transcriptional regulator